MQSTLPFIMNRRMNCIIYLNREILCLCIHGDKFHIPTGRGALDTNTCILRNVTGLKGNAWEDDFLSEIWMWMAGCNSCRSRRALLRAWKRRVHLKVNYVFVIMRGKSNAVWSTLRLYWQATCTTHSLRSCLLPTVHIHMIMTSMSTLLCQLSASN